MAAGSFGEEFGLGRPDFPRTKLLCTRTRCASQSTSIHSSARSSPWRNPRDRRGEVHHTLDAAQPIGHRRLTGIEALQIHSRRFWDCERRSDHLPRHPIAVLERPDSPDTLCGGRPAPARGIAVAASLLMSTIGLCPKNGAR